jgi:hypothetical protein
MGSDVQADVPDQYRLRMTFKFKVDRKLGRDTLEIGDMKWK